MAGSVRARNSRCRTACTRTTCYCPPIKCSRDISSFVAHASFTALLAAPVQYPLLVHSWEQLVRCLPAKVAREAGPHSGLGIDAYVQVTSPLRRYNDCLVHRQLKAFAHREGVGRA